MEPKEADLALISSFVCFNFFIFVPLAGVGTCEQDATITGHFQFCFWPLLPPADLTQDGGCLVRRRQGPGRQPGTRRTTLGRAPHLGFPSLRSLPGNPHQFYL